MTGLNRASYRTGCRACTAYSLERCEVLGESGKNSRLEREIRKLALAPDLDEPCRFQFLYVVRERCRRNPECGQRVRAAQRAPRTGNAVQQLEPPRISERLED